MSDDADPFGCELVTSRLDRDGYAYHGKSRAHIVAWVAVNGPVPDGKYIDHLCRRRSCRAVWHLEAVTKAENERRKSWRYLSRMKACQFGHSLEHAAVTPEGGRICRGCMAKHMGSLARRERIAQ